MRRPESETFGSALAKKENTFCRAAYRFRGMKKRFNGKVELGI